MRNFLLLFSYFIFGILLNVSGETPLLKNYIVVATWNIGHFSNGSKNTSVISSSDYDNKLNKFRQLIYEDIKPDLICLNEYSEIFGKDRNGVEQTAETVLFDDFNIKITGDQRWYSCNALFGNAKLKKLKMNNFDCSQPYLKKNPKANQYYYISADLYIGKKKVKMVCAHLYPWDRHLRREQMQELVNKYTNSKRVLMCGDWNTADYAMFVNAGFVLANDGSITTFPKTKNALDNIIVKGMKFVDVKVVKTDLSDHYPLVGRLLLE